MNCEEKTEWEHEIYDEHLDNILYFGHRLLRSEYQKNYLHENINIER